MKVTDFVHEMHETSAILGRDHKIRVVFSGDQAGTDGEVINLPSMNLNATLTNEQVRLMRGYVDHEAGHIRHSDMPTIIDFYKRCHNNGHGDLKSIHNALEDVWMEDRVIEEYPGAWKNLKQTNEVVKRKEIDHFTEAGALDMLKEVTPPSVCGGIKAHNPHYLTESSNSQEFLDLMGDDVRKWTKKWAEEALKCKDSSEVITLAKSVYKKLQEDPNLEEGDPEDFDPTSGEDMDVGEPGDMSDEDAKAQGKGTGKGRSEKGEGGEYHKHDKDYMPSLEQVVADSYGENPGGGIGDCGDGDLKGGYRVFSTANDITYKRGQPTPNYATDRVVEVVNSTDHSKYIAVKGEISGEINTMKTKLRRALLAKQQRDWDFGREIGRLDTKRLVGAYNGNRSVYKARIDRMEEDTAVTFLIDLSGSMSGSKACVARDCSVALSECLEGSSMPFKVVGFSNNGYPDVDSRGSKFHRYERLDTVVFKDYDMSLKKCRGSIARIDDAIGGNNTDYDFIQQELAILKKRPEKRKVLFVLSDGHPAHMSDASTGEIIRHCKEAIKRAQKDGVECIGIGIRSDAVTRIYDDNVVVNNVNELSSTVFTKLTSLLVG